MLKCSFLAGTYCTDLTDQAAVGITRTWALIPDGIEGNVLMPGTCTGCSHCTNIQVGLPDAVTSQVSLGPKSASCSF